MIFTKVHEFVQNSVFSPRDHHIFSFLHWVHYLLAFSAKYTSLYKTAFSARDQHVLSFSHWAHYLLPIFSKVQGFVQNSVFSPRSARFVNSARGAPLLSHFQQSARACTKQNFSARDQHVLPFLHRVHYLLAFSAKYTSLYKTGFFCPRLARFVIFALGAPIFSDFYQSTRICRKQRFQPEISTFCHFRTGRTTY